MPNAVHEDDANFVGVDPEYRTYAGVDRAPLAATDGGITTRVKALEAYRATGVPYLGYSYMFTTHPSEVETIVDQRVKVDRDVRTAAGLQALDTIADLS